MKYLPDDDVDCPLFWAVRKYFQDFQGESDRDAAEKAEHFMRHYWLTKERKVA